MNQTAARELCVMDQTAADELYEAFAMLAGSDPDNCSYTKVSECVRVQTFLLMWFTRSL